MSTNTDPARIEELLTRGVEELIQKESLRARLASGRVLRIKLGIDPTSPHLHLGRSIPLLKLRDFQELGHQVVFIVGDFTGVIGDTSDKESERPMLMKADIETNMATYKDQVGKILDMSKVEFRYNSEWLGALTYREIGEHADQFSVADFIARENIKRRLEEGKRISLREVLYPLLQGYDSVATKADVELGGTDQRFNLLAGRTLQEHFGQEPQDLIMNPLIKGTDGRKMSSSWGNTITLTMEPNDMYGKVMSMADTEIVPYLTLCTRVALSRVREIEDRMGEGENPKTFKMELARVLVAMYHSEEAAQEAEAIFVETFEKRGVPEDVIEIRPPYDSALIVAGLIASKSELHRLFDDGGVRNAETGEKLGTLPATLAEPLTLKLGKRRFVRLIP